MNSGPGSSTSTRLVALDFLRGLALTLVLVDHVDDLIESQEFFTRWTLKGLGFSDAAEAFVFLSGFTFGWVYSRRLDLSGFWTVQRRAVIRTAQIYAAMMLTTLLAAGLSWQLSRTMRLPLTITTPTMFRETIQEAAILREPVWGLGILVVYVAVLPFLPVLLWLARWKAIAAVGVSLAIYAGSQLVPALNLGDAGFNPLAWQVLVVVGMVLGQRARGGWEFRPARGVIVVAGVILLAAVIVMRGEGLAVLDSVRQQLAGMAASSKTNLGVIRIVHFAAVAVMTVAVVRRWPGIAGHWLARPLVWSGRHSLTLFCVGVLLSYLAVVGFRFLPDSMVSLLFLAADAVVVQFAVAWLIERRRSAAPAAR